MLRLNDILGSITCAQFRNGTNGPLELPEHAEIAMVEVRLPRFSLSDPELLFTRAEFSFTAAGVTLDTVKFVHVANAIAVITYANL